MAITTRVVPVSFVERHGIVLCSLLDLFFHLLCLYVEAMKGKLILLSIPELDFFDHLALLVLCVSFIVFHGACMCLNLFWSVSGGVFTIYVNDADFQYHRVLTFVHCFWCIWYAVRMVYNILYGEAVAFQDLKVALGLLAISRLLSIFREMMKNLINSPTNRNVVTLCDLLGFGSRDDDADGNSPERRT